MSRISRSSQADAIRAFPQTERRQVSCLSLTETPTRTHVLWKSLNTHIQTHFSVRAYSRYITCSKKSDRIWILINCYWHTNNRPSVIDLVRFERLFSSGSSDLKNSYLRRSIVRADRIKKKICSRTFLFQTGHSLLSLSWVETLYSMRLITSLLFHSASTWSKSIISLLLPWSFLRHDTTRQDTTRYTFIERIGVIRMGENKGLVSLFYANCFSPVSLWHICNNFIYLFFAIFSLFDFLFFLNIPNTLCARSVPINEDLLIRKFSSRDIRRRNYCARKNCILLKVDFQLFYVMKMK